MARLVMILVVFISCFSVISGHEDLLQRSRQPPSYQELFTRMKGGARLREERQDRHDILQNLRPGKSGFLNIELGLERVLVNGNKKLVKRSLKIDADGNVTKATTSPTDPTIKRTSELTKETTTVKHRIQDTTWNPAEKSTREDIRESTFGPSQTTEYSTQEPIPLVSKECLLDLNILWDALNVGDQWAIKVVDSFGKVSSGILNGNLVWLGSFDECRQVEVKVNTTGSQPSDSRLWKGQYCTTAVTISQVSLTIGLCMPTTCSATDIQALITIGLLNVPVEISASSVQCQPSSLELSSGAVATISILSFIGFFLFVGTLYDVILYKGRVQQKKHLGQKKEPYTEIPNGQAGSHHVTGPSNEKTPLLNGSSETSHDLDAESRVPPRFNANQETKMPEVDGNLSGNKGTNQGVLSRILLSFSLYANIQKIFLVQRSPNTIDCLHGIRFLSMTWVILGHSYIFALPFGENLAVMPDLLGRWTFLAVSNATVSVDTFFLISGLLSSYLLLKEIRQRGGPKHISWPLVYFHRFWRLTPPYMLMLGVDAALWVHFGNGPQWPGSTWEANCAQNWWTNLLYINNLVHPGAECIGWSWYLSNDMQFFIIMPILVIALYKRWMFGLALNLMLMTTSFLITGLLSAANHFSPSIMSVQNNNATQTGNLFNDVYVPSYTRIGPYLIGILLGYILYRTKRKITINKLYVTLGWLSATACCLAVLYGVYGDYHGHPMDTPTAAFYLAVHRTAWAVGVAWLILACACGYGGVINKLLSWSGLVPLSRLTFMAYLVHPLVIYYYLFRLRQRIYYDDYSFVYLHLGHLVAAYCFAFIASLAFEAPMLGLEKILLKKSSR